jgi:hypothetical protein
MNYKTLESFGSFNVNAANLIKVTAVNHGNRPYLDIRMYYDASIGSEAEWKPTPKGIAIPISAIDDLQEAMDKAKVFFNQADQVEPNILE